MQAAAAQRAHGQWAIGTVVDGRYRIERLLGDSRRGPRFLARDLRGDAEVELQITDVGYDWFSFSVTERPRPKIERAPRGRAATPVFPRPSGRNRALDAFAQRFTLTGMSVHSGPSTIYSGYDRRTNKPVRIVVQPA